MALQIGERFKKAWNAFTSRDPTRTGLYSPYDPIDYGLSSGYRPDRMKFPPGIEKSTVISIYNHIAVDVSMIRLEHVRVTKEGYYRETLKTGLNTALTLDANIDQTGQALIQDIVMSMFGEGAVAVVPVDTDIDPTKSGGYDILSLRTAKITEWYPKHVKVLLYDENDGQKKEIILPKSIVAIIENPFYSVMNEQNSTAQRLIKTLNSLDKINNKSSSEKLDLIVQLPYSLRSDLKRKEAEKRKAEIEEQITNSKFGIAYIDATEHVVQLNRPVENNLWAQAKDLMDQLYNQLGMTKSIFDGTASDEEKVNYYNKTVAPILSAISKEFSRKFLTKTARTQGQMIRYFQNPFSLVPVSQLGEIADMFTRNEVLAPNEVRMELGYKPSDDEKANELRNRNLNEKEGGSAPASIMIDDDQTELTEEEKEAARLEIDSLMHSFGIINFKDRKERIKGPPDALVS